MCTNEYKIRLTAPEKKTLEVIAQTLGYTHGSEGSLSQLMSAIANGKIIVQKK